MPAKQALKRKDPPKATLSQNNQGRNSKRAKVVEARVIQTQARDKALSANGELDVGAFVKSREFEIKALEDGIKSSKHGLSTRAFQQVPRELRRRTASHNVKKVPKRLRARAAREIKEDNTPTGSARKKELTSKQRLRRETAKRASKIGAKAKAQREALAQAQEQSSENAQASKASRNTTTAMVNEGHEPPASIQPINPPNPTKGVLMKAPKPVTKFRKRQKHKSWLPTHIWHAKRAHMTTHAEPLWRFALPISPTEKVYRTTHRATTMRGCVAWDMSYMSTIMLEGHESQLVSLLKDVGVPEDWLQGHKGERWRKGSYSWLGWLKHARQGSGSSKEESAGVKVLDHWIGQVLIIWCGQEQVHDEDSSVRGRKRKVLLRVHPAAFLQLWNELLKLAKSKRPAISIEDLRFDVGSIEIEGLGAAESLVGVLYPTPNLSGNKIDAETAGLWSRLARVTNPAILPAGALLNISVRDPRLRHPPKTVDMSSTPDEVLLELMSRWPLDQNSQPGALFDRTARFASCRLQSSQKAVNRRKGAATPGEYPEALASDPCIPILICATRVDSSSSQQGSWTLMLPWNWVLPVWYSLMHYPLASGGTPRFGGLDERRQRNFEQNEPWFPADFPGTQAGWQWEMVEREKRRREWEKRPKSKRTEWSTVDLGNDPKGEIGTGWACDWDKVLGRGPEEDTRKDGKSTSETRRAGDKSDADNSDKGREGKGDYTTMDFPPGVTQIFSDQLFGSDFVPTAGSLLTIRLSLVHRGVPTVCARIYRLPTADTELRASWLALMEVKSGKVSIRRDQDAINTGKEESHQSRDRGGPNPPYPRVPGEDDLIGFVTTGNFNLSEGRGTGVGSIALTKVWPQETQDFKGRPAGLCIVREAGTPVGRLARWTAV